MSLIETFSNEDIEHYLSTVPYYVHWPRGNDAVRLQVLVIPYSRMHFPYAKVFKTLTTNVEAYGFSYLKQKLKDGFEGDVVFFQNYGPTDTFAAQTKAFLAVYKHVKLSVVYVKNYDKNARDGLPTITQAGVHVCRIEGWKWIAFLLWNLGRLGLQWWAMEFSDCMEDIKEGIRTYTGIRCALDQPYDANTAKKDMQLLLIKMGIAESAEGKINVRECTWDGGGKLSLSQYLTSHTDVVYPNYNFDNITKGIQSLSINQELQAEISNKNENKDEKFLRVHHFPLDMQEPIGIIPVVSPQDHTTLGVVPVFPGDSWPMSKSLAHQTETQSEDETTNHKVLTHTTEGTRNPTFIGQQTKECRASGTRQEGFAFRSSEAPQQPSVGGFEISHTQAPRATGCFTGSYNQAPSVGKSTVAQTSTDNLSSPTFSSYPPAKSFCSKPVIQTKGSICFGNVANFGSSAVTQTVSVPPGSDSVFQTTPTTTVPSFSFGKVSNFGSCAVTQTTSAASGFCFLKTTAHSVFSNNSAPTFGGGFSFGNK